MNIFIGDLFTSVLAVFSVTAFVSTTFVGVLLPPAAEKCKINGRSVYQWALNTHKIETGSKKPTYLLRYWCIVTSPMH